MEPPTLLYGLTLFPSSLSLSICMELWLPQDPTEVPQHLFLALPLDILQSGMLLVSGIRGQASSFGLLLLGPSGLKFPLGLWVT